jgi:hypothetical protein
MQQIIVEPNLGQALGELAGQVVLCDGNGRALGFFSPLPDHPLAHELQLEPPLSIVETKQLRQVRTGKPLSEILDRLGLV